MKRLNKIPLTIDVRTSPEFEKPPLSAKTSGYNV